MNRGIAVTILKEIIKFCPEITEKDVEMSDSNKSQTVEAIYVAHIPDIEALKCIRKITEDYNLTMKQEKDRIAIYEQPNST